MISEGACRSASGVTAGADWPAGATAAWVAGAEAAAADAGPPKEKAGAEVAAAEAAPKAAGAWLAAQHMH